MFARCQRQPENHSADPVYKIAWLTFKGSLKNHNADYVYKTVWLAFKGSLKTIAQTLFTKQLGLHPKAA